MQKLMILVLSVWIVFALFSFFKVTTSSSFDEHRIEEQKFRDIGPPVVNIVYIKNIKCASETLTQMLYRFGTSRNLSFVLPRTRKIYLGWPYQIEKGYYVLEPPPFNLLVDHVVFNATAFAAIMPQDTVYITSLREPFSHLKSMFNYYALAKVTNLTNQQEPFRTYLTDMTKYEAIYKSPEASKYRYCIPSGLSMTRDLMSFNLGLQTGWDTTQRILPTRQSIEAFISSIQSRFSLVLIVEYFNESLILMRRLLRWTWRDIIFVPQNVGNYTKYRLYDGEDLALRKIYEDWSQFDHALYAHFNATLWRKIAVEGDDFTAEVATFTQTLNKVRGFCKEIMPSVEALRKNAGNSVDAKKRIEDVFFLQLPGNRWDGGFEADVALCTSLMKTHTQIMREEQDRHKTTVDIKREPVPPKTTC